MKTLASVGLTIGLFISLTTLANASPTLVGTTTDPTGINNLVVGSTTYDVTFSLTTLNTFTQGTTLSTDADSALASALAALSVTELANSSSPEYFIDLDNSLNYPFDAPACFNSCSSSSWLAGVAAAGNPLVLGNNSGLYVEAADFSVVTAVPEPFTLSLFGAGVAGAVALRRRKRKV